MHAIILSLLLAIPSFAQATYGRYPTIKAKDYSCTEIRNMIYARGQVKVKFWGPFSVIFSSHSGYCNSFEKPEGRSFKARNGERCRAMTCVYDNSNNR